MKKSLFFSLFVCLTFLSVFLGYFCFDTETSLLFFQKTAYWFMLSVFLLFIFFLYKIFKKNLSHFTDTLQSFYQNKKLCFGVSAFLVCAFFFLNLQEKPKFKIVMDEPNLAGVAMSMHLNREAFLPTRAHHILGNFTLLGGYVDKRPIFFPFLVSLLHDFTGYKLENSFVLNKILSALFILLVYCMGYKIGKHSGAIAGVLLFLTLPLLFQNATSGGFELLNMVMLLVCMLAANHYLTTPSNDALSLLCISAVLLSQVRYESILFLLPIAGLVVFNWLKEKKFHLPKTLFLIPIAFIPYLWQHKIFHTTHDFWQLHDKPGFSSPFSPSYFYDNFGHSLHFFFNLSRILPNSFLISFLGLISLPFFFLYLSKKLTKTHAFDFSPIETILAFFLGGFFLHFIVIMTYFYGQLDNPIIQRLSLPLHLPLVLVTLWLFFKAGNAYFQKSLFALIGVFFFTFSLPNLSARIYSESYLPAKEINWIVRFAKTYPKDNEPLFVLSDRTVLWILNKIDALTLGSLPYREEALQAYLNQTGNPKIFVQQVCKLNPQTQEYEPENPLPDYYITKPYNTYHLSIIRQVSLKELIQVNPPISEPKKESHSAPPLKKIASYNTLMETWAANLP